MTWHQIGIALALFSACGSSGKPCSGGGMAVDQRPPPAWLVVPEGAVACHQASGELDSELNRAYEFGRDPRTAFDLWKGHLMSQGWKGVELSKKDDDLWVDYVTPTRERVRLFCSLHVTTKGWCSLSASLDPT